MSYVDGYVAQVPTAKRQEYTAYTRSAADLFRECGALSVVECWGDDVPEGKLTSLPMAVKLEKDETVIFAWIRWPSKAARDAGMKKAMSDPRMDPGSGMPIDGKRMIFGGFEVLVET